MNSFLQVLYAAAGTLGFCLYFHIGREHLLPATLSGAVSWIVYLMLQSIWPHPFFCAFGSSLCAAAAAELLARKCKAPAVIFYIAGIIPLVPGSTLYYMMEAVVKGNYVLASEKGVSLIWTITGIGAGAALVIGLLETWYRLRGDRK